MSSNNEGRLTKAERIAQAREEARRAREAEQAKRRRKALIIRGSVIGAALVVAGVIALVVSITIRNNLPIADSGPVPANMNQWGGVAIGKDGAIVPPQERVDSIDSSTLGPVPSPAPSSPIDLAGLGLKPASKGQPTMVTIYMDFVCPACQKWEQTNTPTLKEMADAGTIQYQYRPSGLLDKQTTTNYSSRAAAAVACVADTNPDKYLDAFTKLVENQPQEGGPGLSSDEIKRYLKDAGVSVDGCIDNRTYRPLAAYVAKQALVHGIAATPTVFVDDQIYKPSTGQADEFKNFIEQVVNSKK